MGRSRTAAGAGSAGERAAFTAVVYVLASGCGWQQLPAQSGVSHSTAHRRFTAWSRADLWQRRLDALSAAPVDAADLDWCSMIVKSAVSRRRAGNYCPLGQLPGTVSSNVVPAPR